MPWWAWMAVGAGCALVPVGVYVVKLSRSWDRAWGWR